MLKFLGRNRARLAALVVAAGIVAAADALSIIPHLTIVAPTDVIAGNNIDGFATIIHGGCVVNCGVSGGGSLGAPVSGVLDPLTFSYATQEFMAPGVATIHAVDLRESATASVILK